MFCKLRALCISILVVMIGVSIWASLDSNVIEGFRRVIADPWGAATLADAYCGFLTFFAWVAYKERTLGSRVFWFVAIMIFGNIAMSSYLLIAIWKLKPNAKPEDLLLRNPA